MPKDTVLLVSNTSDIHCDFLVDACDRKGVKCFRLNTDRFRKAGLVHWLVASGEGFIEVGTRRCNIQDIGLIVFRRPVPVHQLRTDVEPWVGRLLDSEWGAIEAGLSVAARCTVVNGLAGSAMAQNKLVQLQAAKGVGLHVPETLVSTNTAAIESFARQHPCVTKGIVNAFIAYDKVLRSAFTSFVDVDYLRGYNARGVPTLLQRAVTPRAMWRVVVVGKEVFGFRFFGSVLETTADSRQVEDNLDGSPHSVPESVRAGLLDMCSSFPISFASADFIEDHNGILWFLDLNPEGQWAFLEEKFGVRISDAIVGLMTT